MIGYLVIERAAFSGWMYVVEASFIPYLISSNPELRFFISLVVDSM